MKKAFITGVTGQDGSYLAEFLLEKGYEVHGLKRRASQFNTNRVDHLYEGPDTPKRRFILHYGDLTDATGLIRLMQDIRPDEVYNLGAQSHVKVSFESPEYTANVDGLGALRLLEAIRLLDLRNTRFYQASTSELYGQVMETPQTENTPFHPRSPYACAKLFAYWTCVNYREAYGMYACNGILFNHESPRRGETFVTRKITRGLARLVLGLGGPVRLGNLDALRDWGHARDYVAMQWLMLQQPVPRDYVIATGRQVSVRDFLVLAAADMGMRLGFRGHGLDEVALVESVDHAFLQHHYQVPPDLVRVRPGDVAACVHPRYFRPAEVETLLGCPDKAARELGWHPTTTLEGLVAEMAAADMAAALREASIKHLFCED